MSEAEVEALKARLAGLGVRLSATTTPSPGRSSSSPGLSARRSSPSYQPARAVDVEHTSTATAAATKPWGRASSSPGSPTVKIPKRSPGYEYDSDRSVDVSELLERCSRVETILSKAETAARRAEDAQGYERRALRLGYESESAARPRKAGRKKAGKAAKSSPSRRRQASSPPAPPFIPVARRVSAQAVDSPQTPLASVLAQYREAEAVWAQERAKMRRELVEQRKRANRFEADYKKLVNQFDARAVDIKSMKAALKNRDTQLHQLTLKLREAEESLQRCNETAAEELTALTEERDDLKTLLQATLGRLESVDEVLHRADVSTAMMEEKVKALDIERLKAINKAAVARAEVDTLARSQAKMQWQSKLLERMSDIKMSTTRSKKEALAEYEKDFQQGRGQAMSAISEDDDDDDSD